MGTTGSSPTVETHDVVGEVDAPPEPELPPISVQYGPNIIGQLLGYDERTEKLVETAHQLYDHISRPSNKNYTKAQKLVNFVHSAGMDDGRQSISMNEIEKEMMNDVEYQTFLHKKTYGVRDQSDVNKKFNLANMDNVCNEFKIQIEECLENQNQNKQKNIPYFDESFASLNCMDKMDLYNNCVDRKLAGLY